MTSATPTYAANVSAVVPRSGGDVAFDTGPFSTCILDREGWTHCTGDIPRSRRYFSVDGRIGIFQDAARISAGGGHICAALQSGETVCWGNNDHGQRGYADDPMNGAALEDRPDYIVDGLRDLVDVALGYEHSCVLHDDATVSCWGRNDLGQTGGSGGDQMSPRSVGVSDVIALSSGGDGSCVLTNADPRAESGTLSCWGAFGAADFSVAPVTHPSLGAVRAVDLGGHRGATPADATGCALTGDEETGSLACWGLFGGTWEEPTEVVAWSEAQYRVESFSVGERQVCWAGLGHVRCRGATEDGRLGAYDLYAMRGIRAE